MPERSLRTKSLIPLRRDFRHSPEKMEQIPVCEPLKSHESSHCHCDKSQRPHVRSYVVSATLRENPDTEINAQAVISPSKCLGAWSPQNTACHTGRDPAQEKFINGSKY